MNERWAPITYRDFWDFPRIMVVEYEGGRYLFDAPFDEDRDDFSSSYTVYLLPSEVGLEGSWVELPRLGDRIGELPVAEVRFDATRRRCIGSEVFDRLLAPRQSRGNET